MSLCMLLFAAMFVSCSDPTLSDIVGEFQSNLPQDLGGGLKIDKVSLNEECIEFEFVSDESQFRFDDELAQVFMPAVAEALKEGFLNEEKMKEVYRACAKENRGFRLIMKGAQSGESFTCMDFSAEELKAKYPPTE